MKNKLINLALAALAVVLLGSCSKINERIDKLEKRVDGIENEKIASIDSQIASINSSIADLGTIRSNVSSLRSQVDDHSTDIFNLEEADRALKDRILNLEDYLDDVLPTYAEKDWVKATFSTLEQYEATCDTIAKIDARIGRLDERLSKEIRACADSMKRWVNVQFEAYYTAAEMDAALEYMQAEIDSAKVSGKVTDERVDSLANELTKTKAAVDSAKAQLTREYKAAIDTAITHLEGNLDKKLQKQIEKVNSDITALAVRVTNLEISVATLTNKVIALEKMIQTVTIVPAYSDGSVKVEKDTLYLDCIISPVSAVSSLTKANFTVLVNKVQTKAVDIKTISITDDKWFSKNAQNGTVSLKVPVKNYIPESAGSSLTAAVNVRNGISDYTTEFVSVTLPVSVSLDKHSIVVSYSTISRDTTLTATVKNSIKGVTWTSSNTDIATVDVNGKVTIKANVSGKDTIVVKTVEGAKTDTCFVTVLPKGALKGVFSVSATKKVYFSQGNLYYDTYKPGFSFESKQYEFRGSSWDDDSTHISHFFWSKTGSVAYAKNYSESGTSVNDVFFTNATAETAKTDFTVDGVTGKYRTLSTAEWQYLINKDGADNIRKGKYKYGVTVCEKVNCLVLAPDDFTGEIATSYNAAAWASAEAAGLVCFPAAGSRSGSGSIFSGVGVYGYYWSSSAVDEDTAYIMYFASSDVFPGNDDGRVNGYSVRLVTDVPTK